MPPAPLPPELDRFVSAARPAVIATVGADGAPLSAPTWYGWEDGRIVVLMQGGSARHRALAHEPRVSLSILGESWYDHVTLHGRVVELRDDVGLVDRDRIATRYQRVRPPGADAHVVTAVIEVDRYHTWGDPGGSGS